jgi:hypothetical protein
MNEAMELAWCGFTATRINAIMRLLGDLSPTVEAPLRSTHTRLQIEPVYFPPST